MLHYVVVLASAKKKTTSRIMFQRMAATRIKEAEELFKAKQYDGAYYLAGYAVECAIKASICRQFQRHTFPNKKLVFESHDHDAENLIKAAGLKNDLDDSKDRDPSFDVNWQIIREWTPDSRYRTNTKSKAKDLIDAINQGPSSFLTWITTRW